MAEDYKRIKKMADGFIDRIMKELPDVTLNGDREHRWLATLICPSRVWKESR